MKNAKQIKIVNEIMNDAFWLGYILEIKRVLSDYSRKEILSTFLIFFSSIFVEETIKSNYGGLSGKRNITLKDIEDFRNHNLKYCPSENSGDTKITIKEMGIDFNNYIFDLVLYLNDYNLLDINFRSWDFNDDNNFELIDGIVATPSRWMEILMPDIYEQIKKTLFELVQTQATRIKNFDIKKKSYSAHKLFSESNIDNNDKLYILQRYGLVKTTIFIDNILKEEITFDIGHFHFDSRKFVTKIKAIIIEMFWNDKTPDNKILREIFERNGKCIPDEFYSINRNCRNNLHYSDYHYLSKKDNKILEEYQDKYLNNVLLTFDKNIKFKFGFLYKVGISLAKLEYWSRK